MGAAAIAILMVCRKLATPRQGIAFLLLLAVLIECDGGLTCFKCSNISSAADCNDLIQCGSKESCYIRRTNVSSNVAYTLGCEDNERCTSSEEQMDMLDCFHCCSSNGCNKRFCEMLTGNFGGTNRLSCSDTLSECAALKAWANVCANVTVAKTQCRSTCGLCNLVDGSWSAWSSWSMCSTSCGLGIESKYRTCSNPYPGNGGDPCAGNDALHMSCFLQTCPVHGGWSVWNAWEQCSSQCGIGLMKRYRTCDNPSPSQYGHYCIGDSYEYGLCNGTNCGGSTTYAPTRETSTVTCSDAWGNCEEIDSAISICADVDKGKKFCRLYCGLCTIVDGGWSGWVEWSICSVTCGSGIITRIRDCTNPAPTKEGKDCLGDFIESHNCFPYTCPVHGGWSHWNMWNPCSTTCGVGLAQRRRNCNNPAPSHDGHMCFGDPVEYNLCRKNTCAVNGGWTTWTDWGICFSLNLRESNCGSGIQQRTRACASPIPTNGGVYCDGNPTEYRGCLTAGECDKEPWKLVFRLTAGGGTDPYLAYNTGVDTDNSNECMMLYPPSCTSYYRHKLLDNWDSWSVWQVKFALYSNHTQVAYIIFDGVGSDMLSWFSKERVLDSSWTDLKGSGPLIYFSIIGDNTVRRRFFIHENYGGCPEDFGWTATVSGIWGCSFDIQTSTPGIIYARNGIKSKYIATGYGTADVLAIYIKLK